MFHYSRPGRALLNIFFRETDGSYRVPYGTNIQRRALHYGILPEEYISRVSQPLKGYKNGHTTPSDILLLIQTASDRLLEILESTVETSNGEFSGEVTGWSSDGFIMSDIRAHVYRVL